ncbi:MAG: hypothetical protein K0V04_07730 [Deltaproteobacteria bacterium]|nr:hypothetical protein [Deltaproteobacteria bacterium]
MENQQFILVLALSTVAVTGCDSSADSDGRTLDDVGWAESEGYDPLVDNEPAEQLAVALEEVAACPPLGQSPGGWSFCSSTCKCGPGQGDCDSESHCQAGLSCVEDVGSDYGWAWNVDVCESVGCAAASSQVPTMASSNSPSGSVTRSGVYSSNYEAWKAFDNSPGYWVSKTWQSPAWIAYEWDSGARRIEQYELHFNNGTLTSRAPRNWTLQGWNGNSWAVVDTQTNQTGWAGTEVRSFNVENPGFYSKYRLHVTHDNDNRANIVVVSLNELVLKGC